jgi:hypothetical protein
MNLVIVNTRPTLVELPDVKTQIDDDDGNLLAEGWNPQRLLPGENNVSADYWDAVKGNPGVKVLLAAGYLRNQGQGVARAILDTLDSLPMDEAKKQIGKCIDMALLTKWGDTTKRDPLKRLITERKQELVANADGSPVRDSDADDEEPVFGEA